MLNLAEYRHKAKALPDLLNIAFLVDERDVGRHKMGIALNKSGSLMAGFTFGGPDLESSSPNDLNYLSAHLNHAIARLGTGWALHIDMVRKEAPGYIPEELCMFPDPVSHTIDAERRLQHEEESAHFEGRTTFIFSWDLPVTAESWLTKFALENADQESESLKEHISRFATDMETIMNICGGSGVVAPLSSSDLLTQIHGCLTGDYHQLGVPKIPAYLDAVLGAHDVVSGFEPRIHDGGQWQEMRAISISGWPSESFPEILESLNTLPVELRFSVRYIFIDPNESVGMLNKYRRNWFQKRHGLGTQVSMAMGGEGSAFENTDALSMTSDADTAIAEASSNVIRFGFMSANIILFSPSKKEMANRVKMVRKHLDNLGFVSRVESINAFEAFMGSIPGHCYENVRRPLMNTMNLMDIAPTTSIWTGDEFSPNPFTAAIYRALKDDNGDAMFPKSQKAPPLFYGATTGNTPFRFNHHIEDVGHTLIAGPTGCHAKGHPILMADGTVRRVEDVQAGDRVMGPDSTSRTVQMLHRGVSPMYRIVPVKGESFVVNDEHILALKRTNDGTGKAGDVECISVKEYLNKSNAFKHIRKLYRAHVTAFTTNDSAKALPIDPYILGIYLGDGAAANLSVSNPDPEIGEALYAAAAHGDFAVGARKPNSTGVPVFGLKGVFREMLCALGLKGLTSEHKFVPTSYKTGTIHERLSVLAGLLDTDGSLSHGGFDYISKSRQMAEDVVFLARSVGLAAYLHESWKSCQSFMDGERRQYWRVSISGDTDMVPTKVARKQAEPRQQIKEVLVTGFSVEPAGMGAYYGFELDGDHLYLDGNFMVHHNSGKSVLLSLVAAQQLRYPDARVFSFDKGWSIFTLCRAVGGSHYDIGNDENPITLAPLSRVHESASERRWAEDWIANLCILQGVPVDSARQDRIHQGIEALAAADGRSMTDFENLVQDEEVRSAVHFYTLTGRTGNLLDANTDALSLDGARFSVFELENLLSSGEMAKLVTVPVLLYIFHRIEKSLDGSPAIILLDEAWAMLDNPLFSSKIKEWLKVMRKFNVSVIFATQSLSDLKDSPLKPVIMESCLVKILLPNRNAAANDSAPLYHDLGLNDSQIKLLQQSTPKSDYYIVSPEGRRRITLAMGPVALAFCAVSDRKSVARVRELITEHGERWPVEWLRERLPQQRQDWTEYLARQYGG